MTRREALRIAIYHNLPSGGAKRSLFEMAQRLASDHELHVYTLACAEHDFADLRPFVTSHHVAPFTPSPLLHRPLGRLNQLIYLLDLLRLNRLDRAVAAQIDEGAYDVVFVHHCRYRQSPALLRYLKTPSLYYCQEPPRWLYDPPISRPYTRHLQEQPWHVRYDPLPRLYQGMLQRQDRRNARNATVILVNSHHSHEQVWRVYQKRPTVCYLGVDTEVFRPMPTQKERILLSVGSLNPIKGYDLLIKGIGRLAPALRPPLIIISNQSDPREQAYLEQIATELGVHVETRPIVKDSRELASWYSRAQITGFTPMLEPLGLVPLESMACETPVLGVREGGLRETVMDGITGRLVERDPDAVGEALESMLKSPTSLAEMGQRGRRWVQERWDWRRSMDVLEKQMDVTAQARR
jgi:glycosyltransferase involved in cell wall biosynthesis